MPGKNVPAQNGLPTAGKMVFDPDDPEYIRELQRPAVIQEDMNEMERRKRVHQILESKSFCSQLEQLIVDERRRGTNADSLYALERLTKLILPIGSTSPRSAAKLPAPIADLRGTAETSRYSKQERLLRTKLACLFRLVDHFQWNQVHSNHITLRISPESEELLINPDGLLYDELSAGLLAKVDLRGNVLDHGNIRDGNARITDIDLHLAIHNARPDIRCVMELKTPVLAAVSAMQHGLLPLCQEAMVVGPVSYHDRDTSREVDREMVARDLGPQNKVMLQRNHGFVACGQSVEEVFHFAYNLILACETQVRAARVGLDNLVLPSEEVQRKAFETGNQGGGGVNRKDGSDAIKWRVGELEWEAWMRVLDNAGHRTGHIYRQHVHITRAPAAQSDVEVPPAACAYGCLVEGTEPDSSAHSKLDPTTKWINTPNAYQKVEFEETGTSQPKKLTKWVPDATNTAHSNPIKISSPHQFTPLAQNQNPKEFKDKQKAIKEARRADNISAGPQSKILEGVTWEEAAKLKDAEASGTQEMIIIGAASRGIIDPEFRHNAQIYRQLYQPNPFASVTDEEIQDYIKDVERRQGLGGFSDSSFDEVSLMQAARDREHVSFAEEPRGMGTTVYQESTVRDSSIASAPIRTASPTIARDTPTPTVSSKVQSSSLGGWFQRSKSERFGVKKMNGNDVHRPASEMKKATASEEELRKESMQKSPEKKEKKKRFKTPSFLKSKKDKKKTDR